MMNFNKLSSTSMVKDNNIPNKNLHLGNGWSIILLIILEMNIYLCSIWIMIHFQILVHLEDIIGRGQIVINLILGSIQVGKQGNLTEIRIVMAYLELIPRVKVYKRSYVVIQSDWEWWWLVIRLELISRSHQNSSMWVWCNMVHLRTCYLV